MKEEILSLKNNINQKDEPNQESKKHENIIKSIKEKDLTINKLNNEINSLKKDIENINEEYQKNIKTLEDNYQSFQESLISQTNENLIALKKEINELLSEKNRKDKNKDNNSENDEEEFYEVEEDKNEINDNDFFNILDDIKLSGNYEVFKKQYKLDNLGIEEETIKKIFEDCKEDFFDAASKIIEESYKKK